MTDSERELLSAAYDRQVSPADQARVEEQLRTSAEARREWDEMGQLSSLLRDLPRQELPAEFPSRVLKAAEQRSLLPVASGRTNRRWNWVAPFTAAAAVLVLISGVWWLNGRRNEPADVAMGKAWRAKDDAPASAGNRGLSGRRVLEQADAATGDETPAESQPPRKGDGRPDASIAESMEERQGPSMPLPEAAAQPQPAPAPADVSTARTLPAAEGALPGSMANETVDGQQVRVIYVDDADGMQLVQQAFERNQVAVTIGPGAMGKKSIGQNPANTKSANPMAGEQKELPIAETATSEALCVVASISQYENALAEIRKTQKVASADDEDLIEIAQLPREYQQFFVQPPSGREIGGRDATSNRRMTTSATESARPMKGAAPAPPVRAPVAETKVRENVSRSRQARFEAPVELEKELVKAAEKAEKGATQAQANQRPPALKPSVEKAPAGKQVAADAQVRVIFVVRRAGDPRPPYFKKGKI